PPLDRPVLDLLGAVRTLLHDVLLGSGRRPSPAGRRLRPPPGPTAIMNPPAQAAKPPTSAIEIPAARCTGRSAGPMNRVRSTIARTTSNVEADTATRIAGPIPPP